MTTRTTQQPLSTPAAGATRREVLAGLPFGLGAAAGLGGLAAVTSTASAAVQQNQQGQQGGGGPQLPDKLRQVLEGMHDGNQYTLPELPYPADALEPTIDQVTMELHHDKHHQGYVDGLNSTVQALSDGEEDAAKLAGLTRNLSFNYGGHALHSLFWAVMGPNSSGNMGGEPQGALAEAINSDLGGFDQFKSLWSGVAGTVKGSGWVQLVFDPVGARLHVAGVGDHDRFYLPGSMPILPLDIWEHAYYLSYQNRRGDYVNSFFNVVDWEVVGALYEMVSAPYRQGNNR